MNTNSRSFEDPKAVVVEPTGSSESDGASSRYRQVANVLHRWCHGSLLLMAPEAVDVVVLDGTVCLVWTALMLPASAEEVEALLAEQAPADIDLHAHVNDAMVQLRAERLVETVEG